LYSAIKSEDTEALVASG